MGNALLYRCQQVTMQTKYCTSGDYLYCCVVSTAMRESCNRHCHEIRFKSLDETSVINLGILIQSGEQNIDRSAIISKPATYKAFLLWLLSSQGILISGNFNKQIFNVAVILMSRSSTTVCFV